MSEEVKIVRNGQILEITLDRPKANAIDQPTSRKLGDAFAIFAMTRTCALRFSQAEVRSSSPLVGI